MAPPLLIELLEQNVARKNEDNQGDSSPEQTAWVLGQARRVTDLW